MKKPVSHALRALSQAEAEFAHNIEVRGMSVEVAAEQANLPVTGKKAAQDDAIAAQRAQLRDMMRARTHITKEDVIEGFRTAIDQAVLITDPMAQIAGWREIGKMLGYDAPTEVHITLSTDSNALKKQIKSMSDDKLVELLGAEDVIDGDFYEVKNGEAA